MSEEHYSVGKRKDGLDERSKAEGKVIYADDFKMEEMLYGKVFRSSKPAAKIIELDTSEAEKLDGVVTVMTSEDVPNNKSVTNIVGQSADVGLLQAKQRVLAEEEVKYYGEPIALIAAEDPNIAEKALDLIEIEYEEKEGVFDPEEAMKEDAPKVHGENNIIARWKLRDGDVEKGFEEADVIVENTYETQFQEHGHLEPESGVAWIDDDDVLNLRVATQVIEQYREISHILGVPESKVRIRGTLMGGGFGGKEDLNVEPFIALLSWETKKPVKLTYEREEMMYDRHKRHPYKLKYKHGATEDGEIVAMEAEAISDSGAYVYLSPWILLYTTYHSTGPYKIPNVKVDSYSVLTNNTYTSAFRGFGAMQAAVAYESQMDEIAEKLDMNPQELRSKNYLSQGKKTATGQEIESKVELDEAQEKALEALGEKTEPEDPHKKVGRGTASIWQSYGRMCYLHDTASSWVSIEKDGSAVVRSGIPDLGGGQRESLRQITSDVLGIPLDEIQVNSTDTQATPLSGTVTATRALYMSGNAVKKAAEDLRRDLIDKASELLEEKRENLKIDEKSIRNYEGDKVIDLSEVVEACNSEGNPLESLKTFRAPTAEPITEEVLDGKVFPDFTFGSQAAEVEVDTRTGEIKLKDLASCYDVGKAINPKRVEGQMEGGAAQGIGYALMEDYTLKDGIPEVHNLAEYHMPTSVDVPDIKTIILESESGEGPYGAKGIGEPALSATAPAILNAIKDAIGKRIKSLPADPENTYWTLKKKD